MLSSPNEDIRTIETIIFFNTYSFLRFSFIEIHCFFGIFCLSESFMTSRQAYISLASQVAHALNIFTFTIQFHADVCQKMKIKVLQYFESLFYFAYM